MGSKNTRSAVALRSTIIMACRALICLTGVFVTLPAMAMADAARFNIAAQPLSAALKAFADQAHMQVLYRYDAVATASGNAVSGKLEKHAALERLLKNTGLEAVYSSDTAATIRPIRVNTTSLGVDSVVAQQLPADQKEGKSDSSPGFLLAQAAAGQATRGASVEGQEPTATREKKSDVLQEVIVTAQKREERLQDVPVPVTALSADALLQSNQLRLQDYYTSVPGLSVTPGDYRGDPIITIRGLTTGGNLTNPTVGIVIDDVPYGSSTGLGGGTPVPDIDPSELARVEVLRGPQGTLYGASSIGGLLKFVTVDPSTEGVTARVQAGASAVRHGTESGYNLSGVVNVPVSETLALRASGFTRRDPGYVDNVETGQRGVNDVDVGGGRLSALWRPSPEFSLKVSALVQHTAAYGASDVDVEPGLGDWQQSRVRGTGAYSKTIQAYSATLMARLGIFNLTAISGYSANIVTDSFDLTPVFGAPLTEMQFGVPGAVELDHNNTYKFTQELRLSAPISERLDWLLGAFYDHEDTVWVANVLAVAPVTGTAAGVWDVDDFPTTYEEYAAFTDMTFHVTDRLDVQLGGRESQNKQSYSETLTGPATEVFYFLPSPIVNPRANTKDSSFTYLVTPRFKVSSNLMVYARLASGYRPGGPNTLTAVFGLPREFSPDKTQNYEIGMKGDVLDHTLAFDASIYHIAWKDIQLQVTDPRSGSTYYANASQAKSQGAELSVNSRPLKGLTVATWVAWNDAVLTQGFPSNTAIYGASGDRLPYSSRFSGNFSVEQTFPLANDWLGFVGGAVSYVGAREGVFIPTFLPPQRQTLPAYAKTDLRAGVTYNSWSATLFITNAFDRRGLLTGGLGTLIQNSFDYIQPRTVGVYLAKTF